MNPARPTNDHYVPQMYLKRWGTPRPAGHQIIAARADDLSSPFPTTTRNVASEKGFYWGEDHDGVPHHEMERFLTTLENDAATAFRFILDKGSRPADNALPPRWPTRADDRLMLAGWIAAQLLRTTHQRERLWKLTGDPLEPPRSMARANKHLEFMLENIGPLAGIIFRRPWGIGFSSACLMTSDVPVQLLNAQDDDEQLLAASFWDLYLPLDPHRFMFLPGFDPERPDLRRDHLVDMSSLTVALNEVVVETASRQVFWHPNHDARRFMNIEQTASIRRQRSKTGGSTLLLNYVVLSPEFGVERRWLDRHVWDDNGLPDASGAPRDDETPQQHLERLLAGLDARKARYDEIRHGSSADTTDQQESTD